MAGHSKWAKLKHHKPATDAKRSSIYTKITREIVQAVRHGSASPDGNFRLRLAIQKAKDANMPMDNVDRAIKRAAGQGADAENMDEIQYEGYGPGGIAIIVQALTPNRNRTASEVRAGFSKYGGALGETGSVGWNFDNKGLITLTADPKRAEEVMLAAIDAGADDVKVDGESIEVYTAPEKLEDVRRQLEEQKLEAESAELTMQPKTTITLSVDDAMRTLKLLDALESLDDAQKVYSNADFPEEALEQYEKGA